MKLTVRNLDNEEVGDIELADEIFGLPIRRDILARVVNWQLARRRAGTHKAKGISEIRGTTKSPTSRRARAAPAKAACDRRSSAAARVFSGRWCALTHSTCRRRCVGLASRLRCRPSRTEGKLVVIDSCSYRRRQDQGAAGAARGARWGFGVDHRRIGRRGEFRAGNAQSAARRCAAAARCECL